jgi:hypothetical protein
LISAYAPVQQIAAPAGLPVESHVTSPTQQVLLELVYAVRNLRDESDVQCLAFLAGELGLLRETPFCFSLLPSCDGLVPESLVLRDTFHTMISHKILGWDGGNLLVLIDPSSFMDDHGVLSDGVSWLGALLPSERQMLTQVTVQLRATGGNLLSAGPNLPFQRIVSRIVRERRAAEATERNLLTVCQQLGVA